MLPLESSRWSDLEDAYGTAGEIPELLRQLGNVTADKEAEVWFSLWSALAHQGDVYSASFAAVPHVVEVLATAPTEVSFDYLQFPAWVEICRVKKGIVVTDDLAPAYSSALARLPSLIAQASTCEWPEGYLRCALAAIAVAKGKHAIAEAVLELTPEVAEQFLDWFYSQ